MAKALIVGRKKVFFGWWIVAAGFVATVIHGAAYTYGMKVLFLPLIDEFGWGRAALSGAFSLAQLEGGALGPPGGWITDKLGPRKIMLVGMFLFGLGFIAISRVNSLLAFYVVYILLLAVGDALATVSSVSTAVANWFILKRSRAMGIALSGIGVGGAAVPVVAWLVSHQGWRPAAVAIGIGVWVAGIPLGFVMRHRPEQYGYVPDGGEVEIQADKVAVKKRRFGLALFQKVAQRPQGSEVEFTAREAVMTKAFWLLSAAFAIRLAVTTGVTLHLMPYLDGFGASPEVAALALSMLGITSILGRAGFGWFGDLFPIRYVASATLGLIALGSFIFAGMQSLWQVVPFLLIFAPAYGNQVSLMPAIRGEYFGRKAFGTIQGCMGLVLVAGTVSGPVFAGYLYDVSGSYRVAFLVFGLASVLAAFLAFLAKPPRR